MSGLATYDLWFHRAMCADRVRVGAYARALRAVVRPDDVVLDLGCGIGVLTVLAAKAGARRVYAVDVDDSVHYARRVAADNGVGDRVTFFRGRMEDVDLPEKPTVIVGDLHGGLPLTAGTASAWNAARARAIEGARTIPVRDVVAAQPVRSDSLHARLREDLDVEGVSLDSLRPSFANGIQRDDGDAEEAAPLSPLFEIRYDRPLDEDFAGEAAFATKTARTVDAFQVGFESFLAPGVSLRSFGAGGARIYGPVVVPTLERLRWEPGVPLALRFERRRVSSGAEFLWAVDVGGARGPWQGRMLEEGLSLDVLRASLPSHVSRPDAVDEIDWAVLDSVRDGRTVAEAIERAVKALPAATSRDEVTQRVVEVARRRQARTVRRIEGA